MTKKRTVKRERESEREKKTRARNQSELMLFSKLNTCSIFSSLSFSLYFVLFQNQKKKRSIFFAVQSTKHMNGLIERGKRRQE